jgi:hypothetical protein
VGVGVEAPVGDGSTAVGVVEAAAGGGVCVAVLKVVGTAVFTGSIGVNVGLGASVFWGETVKVKVGVGLPMGTCEVWVASRVDTGVSGGGEVGVRVIVGMAVGFRTVQLSVVWHFEHCPRSCPAGRWWQDLHSVYPRWSKV